MDFLQHSERTPRAINHHNGNLVCVHWRWPQQYGHQLGFTQQPKVNEVLYFESWWRFTYNYELSSTIILWLKKTIPLKACTFSTLQIALHCKESIPKSEFNHIHQIGIRIANKYGRGIVHCTVEWSHQWACKGRNLPTPSWKWHINTIPWRSLAWGEIKRRELDQLKF